MPINIFWNGRNAVYRNAGADAPFSATASELEECCCGPVLKAWYKADAITGLSDGDSVASWIDSTGNGYTVTQGTAANQPTYKTNILNSLPVVRFDGSNDFLTKASTVLVNGPMSVYMVVKSNTTGGWHQICVPGGLAAYANLSGSNWGAFLSGGSQDSGQSVNSFKILTIIANNYDDIDMRTAEANDVNRTGGTAWLGGNLYLSHQSTEPFSGDIAEIQIYEGAHTDTDRDTIESDLATKWGL